MINSLLNQHVMIIFCHSSNLIIKFAVLKDRFKIQFNSQKIWVMQTKAK